MARHFVAASSQFLERTAAVVTAAPLTLACWVNPTSTAANQQLVTLEKTGAGYFLLGLQHSGTPKVQSGIADGSASDFPTSAGSLTYGSWLHAAAVFASTTSRTVYLNGVGTAGSAASVTPTGIDRTTVGRFFNAGAPTQYANGDLGEIGLWNVALAAADILALALGMSPLLIRPDALVGYYPLIGQYSPEIDLMRANGLTVTGATAAAHPLVIAAAGPLMIAKPAVVAAAGQGRMFQVF